MSMGSLLGTILGNRLNFVTGTPGVHCPGSLKKASEKVLRDSDSTGVVP